MASPSELGRLHQVSLRDVWLSEPGHFTPWLARPENLSLLSDTLGVDLELDAQEKGVGPFRADIVCKDTSDGTLVIVENQLERTDHTHLGQLMTYAAGLNAVSVVWIAERFTEEHRAALDWLNEITNENVSFFGLEVELWRIGNSPIAPKFNVVCKPNDWIKSGSASARTGEGVLSQTRLIQQEYWRALRETLAERQSKLKPQKARPQHWLTVSIGRSHFHLAALVNTPEERIGVELYLGGDDAKAHFKRLEDQKQDIELEFGAALDWRELPQRNACRIMFFRSDSSIKDRSMWPEQHAWLADMLEKMYAVFRPRVLALPADYQNAEVALT